MPKVILTQHDARSFTAIAERLERAATTLRMLAVDCETHNLATVGVTHQDQLTRGMTYVENFSHAARSRVYETLKERGHFDANG